jgi:hypothetical protein
VLAGLHYINAIRAWGETVGNNLQLLSTVLEGEEVDPILESLREWRTKRGL